MKTYEQLTETEQARAVDKALTALVEAVLAGAVRFNDEANGDDLQARIDRAFDKADRMQTPWFADEYVMEAAGDELRGMAQCDAEDAIYAEPGELVVSGVAA